MARKTTARRAEEQRTQKNDVATTIADRILHAQWGLDNDRLTRAHAEGEWAAAWQCAKEHGVTELVNRIIGEHESRPDRPLKDEPVPVEDRTALADTYYVAAKRAHHTRQRLAARCRDLSDALQRAAATLERDSCLECGFGSHPYIANVNSLGIVQGTGADIDREVGALLSDTKAAFELRRLLDAQRGGAR